jgi:Zn-dependent protease/CBS domain-containing protein
MRVARVAGFDVKIDASWLIIAALIVWSLSTGYFPSLLPASRPSALLGVAVVAALGLFASLILHELAHSIVARAHGLKISGITLFLFGGVAELESEPADAGVELRVAIAGPIASLLLAAAFWSVAVMAQLSGLGPVPVAVLHYLATINLVLAVFNLLAATRRAVAVSAIFAWALIAFGVLAMFGAGAAAGLWPILVGTFLLAIGRASYRQQEMRHLAQGRSVADLMTRNPIVARPDQSLAEVVNRLFLLRGISFVPVVEDGELQGFVDLPLIRRIDREHWATTHVDDVVERVSDDYAVPPDMPLTTLIEKMTTSGRRKFLVVDGGSLAGVITLSDISAHLAVARQIAA